jgi:hypothetical protein
MPLDTNKFYDPTLLALIDQAAEIWSLPSKNDPPAFANAWAAKILNTRARFNKKQRPFFQLACCLAVTPLQSLLNITPDKLVLASPLVNAWIGSTKSFGLNADGPPPIFEKFRKRSRPPQDHANWHYCPQPPFPYPTYSFSLS